MNSGLRCTRPLATRITALAAVLLLAACSAPRPAMDAASDAPADAALPLRVMSFNIRYNNPADGIHAWTNRRDRAASIVRFHGPDVVGLQEALKSQIDDLADRLPFYAVFGEGRDGGDAGEFSAVLYRQDRFDLLEDDTFWLSETPDVPASKSWDAAITRIVTWGRLRDRATGRTFVHFNTHFDHVGEVARTESARLLADTAATIAGGEPFVITGDFNFTSDASGYALLAGRYRDAMRASETPAHGPDGTYYGGFEVTGEAGRRIDYIFVSPSAHVRAFGTLTDNWQGAYASDHLPVLAVLTL